MSETCSDGMEYSEPMYCSECDEIVPENWDRLEDSWKCPECGATPLFEDKEEYIEVVHANARFQKERGWGPWCDDSNGGNLDV